MPTNTLNLDLIQEMVTNYKSKQYLSIVTNTINPMTFDAQSVWFELDALKNFIATIEEQVADHPQCPVGQLGVRFYYSAYPKSEQWDEPGYEDIANVPTNYQKLHTLIAIPTAEINGVNQDFNPADVKTYTGVRPPSGEGIAIMSENHGDLTPPKPPIGLWF